MIKVETLPNESPERLLTRFKIKVKNSQIMKDYEDTMFFVSKSEKKRSKKKLSKRRKQKLLLLNE